MQYMFTPHNRWFLGVLSAILVFLAACNIRSTTVVPRNDRKPVDQESFVLNPFGYEPSKANFQKNLPVSFKLQVYTIRNKAGKKDTILRFYHRKSEIFCFKTTRGAEKLMGLNVYDTEMQLVNGVHPGMTRNEFNACFTNLEAATQDTVKLVDKNVRYTFSFIFKKEKLKVMKILARKEK
jgi:hypothetical protein